MERTKLSFAYQILADFVFKFRVDNRLSWTGLLCLAGTVCYLLHTYYTALNYILIFWSYCCCFSE